MLTSSFDWLQLISPQVVDEDSARIGVHNEKLFPVDANHRTICKFSAANDQNYTLVGAWIAQLAELLAKERHNRRLDTNFHNP